jgi:hypothetical protein
MKSKSLSRTNPFLIENSDAKSRLTTCVSSSTAIETGQRVNTVEAKLKQHRSSNRFAVKLAQTKSS